MSNFGACENLTCERFYGKGLRSVRELIVVLNSREGVKSKSERKQLKFPSDLEPQMAHCRPFFQFREKFPAQCSKCHHFLHPIGRLSKDAELIELLNFGNELQRWDGAF